MLMFRRGIVLIGVIFSLSVFLAKTSFAMRLLTQEEALKKVFGTDAQIATETKELAEPTLSKVRERLGGSLVSYQKGSKSAAVEEKASFDFYFASKQGQKIGVAIIDDEPGKWGPVEFIIAMDLQGTVTKVEVMSYEEKRGQPIARRSFMSQFEGKTSSSPLKLNKDITGVSGATISSNCAVFAIKKAIVLYEALYLNR